MAISEGSTTIKLTYHQPVTCKSKQTILQTSITVAAFRPLEVLMVVG